MFISITFLFTIEHVIVWTNISLFTSSIIGFQCGLSTHEGTWLIHVKNFLMFNTFHHPLNFTSITRLVNGVSSSNFPCLETQLVLLFVRILDNLRVFRRDISSIYSSTKWIVLVGLNFDYFYVHTILIHHLETLQVLPRLLVKRIYLRLTFLCFILFLGKAYRRYIPVSRDFIHLRAQPPRGSIYKNQIHTSIHTSYIYWESKLHIHNTNIVHKYGTCLKANAFQ